VNSVHVHMVSGNYDEYNIFVTDVIGTLRKTLCLMCVFITFSIVQQNCQTKETK